MSEQDFDAKVESIKNDYLWPAIRTLPNNDGDVKQATLYALCFDALLFCKLVSPDDNEAAAQYYRDIADGAFENFVENTDLTVFLPKKD